MLARGGPAARAGSRGPEAGEDAGADAEQALRLLLGDRCEEALDAETLRQVLPLLRHPEPTFRELTLRALALAPRKLVVLFRESEARTGAADVLLGVASDDERMENRCLAGTVLGRLLPAFEYDSRRQRLEADATAAVFKLFRDAFERQSLHHALAAATAVAPYLERAVQHQGPNSPLVQTFVRESLKVLSSAVSVAGPISLASSRASELQHPLLLATLLRILREHLRDTDFNRRTFVEPFREFVHQIFVVKRGPAQWVNREAPEFLRNEASWFLCKWFQIPDDDFIVMLGPAVIRASDDDETDDEEAELPPGLLTTLTFQMAVPSVELSGSKREVILHLTNPGNQAELFALQTFPSTNFAAVPAFGVVAAKSSMSICVRFVQDLSDPSLAGACVRGFLRVRSRHGVAGERVALSAYHGPLLEVLDTELSFGHLSCARGSNRERTLPLIVRNRAKVPCNASFEAVEDHDAVFLVQQSQALIMPGEELWVDVTFRPRERKGYNDAILVSGHGSSPLRVHEEELEFGILQLDHAKYASATKTFRVENLDPSQSIPISFSSDRPTEVFAEQTTLKPREVREITVRLRTSCTGVFQALLVIASPTCESVSVTLQAFVGNLVTIPLSPNIGLPVQPTGATATFELPLKNYYSSPVELYLTGFEDSPCTALFQSPTQETLELREGVTVVMHPFEDVSLELRFSSTKPGLFRLPRRLKAKRLDFANLRRLLAVSISHEHPAQELAEHEEALNEEKDEEDDNCSPTGEISSSASPDGFVAHETNLLISQRVTPVFGNPCQNERPRATVEVRNISSVSQPFKALVSSPFVLRQPSLQEGFVDPHDILRLEVEIDASLENVTLGPTWGFLSILVEKGGHLRPLCSTLLQGAATAPIHLSCPHDGLIFRGDADASPFRIVVDQEGAALADRDYVMKADFHLKPWEHCNLTLRFKVDNGGVYAAPLLCVVHDPFALDADSEASKKQAIKVFSGMLDGGAHSNECVATSPTVVDFGDLSVGRSLRQSVLLTNFFRHDLAVALAVDDGPFSLADSQTCALMSLPSAGQDPARRVPLDVVARPGISRNYVRFCRIMSLSGPEEPKNLILRVRAGVCELTTNFGNPSRVWTFSAASSEPTLKSESTTCVDFGIIPTGRTVPARLDLILRNCGTRSVDVLRVHSKLPRLRWSIETLPGHTAEQLHAPGITPSQLQRMRRLAVLGALLTHDEATDARVNAIALEAPDVVTHSASLPYTVDWDEVDFYLGAVQDDVRRDLRAKALRQMDQDRAQVRSAANTLGKSVVEKSPSSPSRVNKESSRGGRDEETNHPGIEEDESENTLHWRANLPHEPLEEFNGALARYGVGLAKPIETPLRLDPGKHVRISLQMDFEQGDTGAIDGDLEVHTDEPGAAASSIHVFRVASKFQPELVFDSSEISFGVVAAGSLGTGFLTIRNPGVRDPDANNVDASRFGNLFSFVPAVGTIQSGETRCVTVRYLANDQGLHDVTLHVTWNTHSNVPESVPTDTASNLIRIHCSGSGGLPQLHVRQARIKYEQAIVGVANLAHLQVFNYGTAECFVAFKMPIKSLHVSHNAEGICVPPRDSIQIPVIFTPTTLERVETTLVVHMIQDASVFYEVDVSAFVGVPDLSITPERALHGLDFDVALVKQTHVRSFTVTNIGDVGLDFACAFLRPTRAAIERHMRRASAIANGQRRNSLAHGPKRQSLDKSCRESWLDTYSFPDDYEDFVPEYLTVEPMEGTFSTGMMIHFTVSFTPLEREKESHAIFAIQNRFDTIKAEIRGVGGDPLLELDTPLRVIDFGLCEAGQAYERTIHVMNPGNVPYDFIVEPDPSDADLRATLLQFAHVAGEDSAHAERSGGAAGASQKPRKSLVHGANELTEHLPRALAKFGFALETSGTCNAYGRSPVRFTFKVPETVNFSHSTRSSIFSVKIQLRHATGYEQLTLRAKEAFASLELHDTDQMPLQDTVVDFGISAVRQTHLRTVLLHNSGKLPAVFSLQSNASSEYAIFPRDGTVGPGESLPLQVSFAPTLSDRVEGNFVAIYNSASRLSIPVAGTGGKGVVDVEFVSERDKSMHGLDFQLVSTHVLMEKKVLLHNIGQVPLRLVCESTSPSYTIGSIRMTDVQAATPGYGSKFKCSNGEAERLGPQSSHGAPQYASPMMIVPRKGRRGKSQQSQHLQKSHQQHHSAPQRDPGGSEVTSGRTGPSRGSIFLPSGDDGLLRAQSKLALDHYGKSGDDTEGHVVVECTLPPGFFAILRVRLFAEREITYAGMLKVRSEFDAKSIPLRARGGGVKLRHTGDLDFGQIACDHTYTRTITLSNSGSIPSSVEIYWKMKPSSREAFALSKAGVRSGTVLLKGSTTRLGLRRFWHWALENVLALVREARALTGNQELTADQREALLDPDADLEACLGLRDTTKRNRVAKISAGSFAHRKSQSAAAGTLSGLNEAFRGLQAAGETAGARVAQILERFHKYQEIQLARQEDEARDLSEVVRTKDDIARDSRALREFLHASASRREHAANNAADIDPQQQFEKELEDSRFSLPHVQVTPRQGTLSKRMSMDVTVTLNTSIEGSFEATLVVAPTLPGVGPYEIPVRAESQEVRIIVDDLGTINFGRQALGETKVIRRVFENQGSMAAEFRIRNTNADLVADPCDGVLEPGDVLAVDFVYSPSSEGICAHPVLFETNCTAPIVLDVYAGGGYPQLDLDHYESFDFGRCMVGKTIPKRLRIGNSGNAVLTITALNFQKHRRRTHAVFERGEGWPQELTSGQVLRIAPSESYYVPLVFHPNSESHFEEVFTIQTTVGSYSLHLFGSGREAVLSLSVHRIDFLDCIVGNAYQRSFEISNAGDLVYPLDISLLYTESNEPAPDKKKAAKWTPLDDLKAEPQHLSIAPFEKRVVTVTYLPSKAVEENLGNVRIALSSIYSNFDIPLRLHAGTADLVVNPPVFDFGHFQVSRPAPAMVTFSNAGTMGFGFRLKRVVDDLDMNEEGQNESSDVAFPFRLSRWEGYLPPGESVEIVATFVVGAKSGGDLERFLGSFHKEIHAETDLVGSSLVLVLRGKCDSSTLRSEEFDRVQMGACAVGDLVNKTVTIRNYGGYPAEMSLQPSFPLKVAPKSFMVPGHGEASFVVSWKPLGGYELRGSIKAQSNVGLFDIQVNGVGVYPKFYIEGSKVDFGVCAPGVEYERSFVIRNTGKIKLEWSVPAVAPGYRVLPDTGVLDIRQSQAVVVFFKPVDLGRFPGDFIVESRGRYKIVSASGRTEPEEMEASKDELAGSLKEGETPLQVKLLPGQFSSIQVGVDPGLDPVDFAFTVHVDSAEAAERIAVKGTGHVIRLSPEARATLLQEQLTSLDMVEPCENNSFGEGAQYSISMHDSSVRRVLAPVEVDDEASWRRLEACNLEPIDVARDLPRLDFILDAPKPFLQVRPK
ncbi:Cilia- and flagella-associated protein 65 [Hondaea fermentalgiana]|uniref:Cilia-and flagella-associated protein 65 n=1 Tax=Hondaea fermentalgiana TaxID=2315210 RepID=A0A2R5G5X3_9STRA|nr:Cilia- and flagella-associated protein 65 [Hondaea fermentalgiana]|eukprot:GBG25935.1 Cilia- and flagella-associated protein 65 [Hondaea fermentalgiana]